MNDITINLTSNPDLEPLKEKEVGHTCDLTGLSFKVTSNDGKTLKGEITDIELGGEYDKESPEENAAEPAEEPGEMPMAMKAMKKSGY